MVFLICISITSLALAVDIRPAFAHAFLLRTEPADGTVLSSAPKQMRFWFSEPPEIDLTTIALQDGEYNSWDLKPYADSNDPSVVIVDVPDMHPGAYRVTWRTVSDEDLHVISGFVVFGLQQAVSRDSSRQSQPAAPIAEVFFHWVSLLAFAAAFGALINIYYLLPSVRRKIKEEQRSIIPSLEHKMTVLMLWCCVIALMAGLVTIWQKAVSIQTGPISIQIFNSKFISSLMSIVYIRRELASELCLMAIIFLTAYSLRQSTTQETLQSSKTIFKNILLFLCVLLWILFQSLNSHASAFKDFSPTRVMAYAFHLLGAGLWIGGQIALILLIAPRLRNRNEQYILAREIYVQFGYVAAIGVAVLIVTGIYSGGQQVASLDALLLTTYGRALIFKSFIVILTGLIGLWHSSLFHPRVARLLFRLVPRPIVHLIFGKANPPVTLRLQLLGGVAIFLLAVFMGSTEPARGPEFEAAPRSPVTAQQPDSLSQMADDLLVNFSIKPNQPGQNFINVDIHDTRRPSPGPVEEVTVNLSSQSGQARITLPLSTSDAEKGYQVSTEAIQSPGDWKVSVSIHRTGLEDTVLEVPWRVAPSAPVLENHPPVFSNLPLAPWLTTASASLSILLACIWLAVLLQPRFFSAAR